MGSVMRPIGYGDGYGHGEGDAYKGGGYGCGNCYDHGYGCGSDYDNGYGDGDGNGYGNGYGDGYGDGYGTCSSIGISGVSRRPNVSVQLLPGWQNSKGATLEHHIAEGLGLQIFMPPVVKDSLTVDQQTDWAAA